MSETLLEKELSLESSSALPTVAIVGLGYVGLPVAVAFARQRPTIGYDLSARRVENLRHKVDATGEVSTAELIAARHLRATTTAAALLGPFPGTGGIRRINRGRHHTSSDDRCEASR